MTTSTPHTHPVPSTRRRWWLPAAAAGAALSLAAALTGTPAVADTHAAPVRPAAATSATTYTSSALSATVTGTTVAFSTTVAASVTTKASSFGFCVFDSANTSWAVTPAQPFTLSTTGSTYNATRTLPVGKYRYYACGTVNGVSTQFGPTNYGFLVQGTPDLVGAPRGDQHGWDQVLTNDFLTTATPAQMATTYAGVWQAYDDNSVYKKANVSVHDGMFDVSLPGSANGGAGTGAGGVFGPPDRAWATMYGKFSIRFKAVGADGNGTAMMLWPSSDKWGDGEIDYPEGDYDSTFYGHHHPMGCTDCSSSQLIDTGGANFRSWHVATVAWKPGSVSYYLDDQLLDTVTHDVPTTDHRFTVQTASNRAGSKPGHLLIDWVAQYAMKY